MTQVPEVTKLSSKILRKHAEKERCGREEKRRA